MRIKRILILMLSVFILSACNNNPKQEAIQENKYKYEGLIMEEGIIVLSKYASNTLFSIQMADIASQEAQAEKVREFAKTLAKDHRMLFNELEALSANYNMSLPAKLTEEQQQAVESLKLMEGHAFDMAYLDMAINYHEAFSQKMEEIIENTEYGSLLEFARLVDSHHYVHLNSAKRLKLEMDA